MTTSPKLTPAQSTKIAKLVDAISALMVANIAPPGHADRISSEDELALALKEFLLPAIRVIDCEPQGHCEPVIVCRSCHEKKPCKINCPGWAASIREESTLAIGDNVGDNNVA